MTRTVELIGSDGATYQLDGATGYHVTNSDVIFGTVENKLTTVSTLRGDRVVNGRPSRVTATFAVHVTGSTPSEHDQRRRALVASLVANPSTPVSLVVEAADGRRSMLQGQVVSPPDGPLLTPDVTVSTIPIDIEAVNRPYWTALEAIEIITTIGVAGTTPWVGQMPLDWNGTLAYTWSLAGYYIEDAAEQKLALFNDGPLDTWPEYTITGPASTVELAHERTGLVFTWAGTLATGEVLKIVTDPDHGRTVRNGTVVVWDEVAADAEMSPLVPGGRNNVRVGLTGGVAPNTTVKARWFPRYTSP